MSVIFNVIICRRFYKEFIKTLFFSQKYGFFFFFFLIFKRQYTRFATCTRLRREIDAYSFETDNILRALPVPQPRRHTASGTRRNRSCWRKKLAFLRACKQLLLRRSSFSWIFPSAFEFFRGEICIKYIN